MVWPRAFFDVFELLSKSCMFWFSLPVLRWLTISILGCWDVGIVVAQSIHRRTQASLCALWMVVGICGSRSGQLHGPVSRSSVFEASPQKSQKKIHTWKCFSAPHVEIKVGEICLIWPDVLLLHESGPQCFCHYKSCCKQLSCWCVPTSLGECYRTHFFFTVGWGLQTASFPPKYRNESMNG